MDRSKVICHMYLSIDGKIDGNYMDEAGCDISGQYYDKTIWEMGNANANGRTTAEMYFANENIDYSKYDTHEIDYSDNVIKSDYYWVIFDRKGGMALQTACIDTRIKNTIAITMYDMSRVTAKGYFDSADNEESRHQLRVNINNQITIDFSNQSYQLAGGVVDPNLKDVPDFVHERCILS